VPHIVCGGFTLEDTEDALVDLHFLGINNILVIRGDPSKNESQFEPEPGGHRFAIHLMKQVMNMNHGIYLEDDLNDGVKTDFCIGVAGYPEKHYEAPNMQSDLLHLKSKVEAGASYIITQMFFDTGRFIEFVKACRALGITVPIIPGIKPLTQKKHVNTLPRLFHITIPEELAKAVNQCRSDEDAAMVGVEWCIQQCKELMEFNVPLLHFYTMSNSVPVKKVVASLF
jgi:methylenetetrahydrofolate reductase (NADPH)